MPISPSELRNVSIRLAMRGYDREAADRLLGEVADSYDAIVAERDRLTQRVEELEAEVERLSELKDLETVLRSALERSGAEIKENAIRRAEFVVREAVDEARSITSTARTEREALDREMQRVRTILREALDLVGDPPDADAAGARSATPAEDDDPGDGSAASALQPS
jgi:cell division septum initiation protein DivIVA